jgi:RNA polymerase sigma factor (sigma-70 family)
VQNSDVQMCFFLETHLSFFSSADSQPSLDEAVQEGIFGLSTAAERFEPERNLKFGTYATHWITNSIRNCFNQKREVGVRVPVYFHVYRQKYQAFVREQYKKTGGSVSLEDAAKELELSPDRLTFILTATTAPVSIDAAPNSRDFSQAGKAGADDQVDGSFTLANVLKCDEPTLLDQIEVSLLRQCLENAMATELSPHERDVLRLRHGLDDGVSRTIRQVAEICGGSLSQSDVRTAEIRACRKLRSPYSVYTVQLHEFLDFVGGDISTVNIKRSQNV